MDNNTTYPTGGDVSRFQRRSVPARAAAQPDQGGDSLTRFANALMGKGNAPAQPAAVVSGSGVTVTRGNSVTVVPVGAR